MEGCKQIQRGGREERKQEKMGAGGKKKGKGRSCEVRGRTNQRESSRQEKNLRKVAGKDGSGGKGSYCKGEKKWM